MEIEVLISAMHQEDYSLVEKTNVSSRVTLVNQCDRDDRVQLDDIQFICTKERGLSNSRNMAIENAHGDICLLCDDDEYLVNDYTKIVEDSYNSYPQADFICFIVDRAGKKYSTKPKRITYLSSLKIASWQISFKRNSILKKGIKFDNRFGSGTVVGSGEENIFLFDCIKAGLKIQYVPVKIGEVEQKKSNWFKGFDEKYFFNRGKIIKRLMGSFLGYFYCLYFCVTKYPKYKRTISFYNAYKQIISGLRSKNDE